MKLQFQVGNGEFGEIYHLIAASYLLQTQDIPEEIAIDFVNFPNGKEVFEFFKIKLAILNPNVGCQPLPLTANIIFQCFYGDCLRHLTEIITKTAQREGWVFPEILHDHKLATTGQKLLIWKRDKDYKPHRNSSQKLLKDLVDLCSRHGTTPVVVGKGPSCGDLGVPDVGEFYTHEFFKPNSTAKQLWFLDQLFRRFGAIANVGMMSGAMDGPAMFFGHKTVYLARHRDATPRMQKVSMAVPNLIWHQVEYEGSFKELTERQLRDLEQKLWGRKASNS